MFRSGFPLIGLSPNGNKLGVSLTKRDGFYYYCYFVHLSFQLDRLHNKINDFFKELAYNKKRSRLTNEAASSLVQKNIYLSQINLLLNASPPIAEAAASTLAALMVYSCTG